MAHQFGITRLRIPVIPQWHNPDGTLWERPPPPKRPKLKDAEYPLATERPITPTQQEPNNKKEKKKKKKKKKIVHPPAADCSIPSKQHKPNKTIDCPPATEHLLLPKQQQPKRKIKYPPATERRLSSIATTFVGKKFIDREPENDSEDSESSSEDEVIERPVVRGSISESFADQINATSLKASPTSQLQSTLREAVVCDERQHVDEVALETPTEEPTEQQTEQLIEETSEPLEDEPPVEQPLAKEFNLDAEESTQDVYEAVDEVLKDVCSSTRALPPSTSTDALSRTDQLMTKPSSDHDQLVLEPMKEQQVAAETRFENIGSDDDESMAEVGEESGESDIEGISTGSTSDAGSNIVVAMNPAAGYQADDEDEEMQDVQPAQNDIPNRPSSSLSSPPPSSQLIAYVDLTAVPSSLQEEETSTSQPSEHDEPLDHLEKLLRSPKKVKKEESIVKVEPVVTTPKLRTPKKTTGSKSPYFAPQKNLSTSRRVPAGTSVIPVPALTSATFGIIQEKLWQEPFWLLIAVTLLNKTTGRAAVPIFENIKRLFPTPEKLAGADQGVLLEMVRPLGLHNARSKRLVDMAQAWVESPPVKGRAFRTLNYPTRGDGRAKDTADVVEGDVEVCNGSLEIGHMPGCGPYAYDSWRMFCRDHLRGVANDYDGKGAEDAGFEAEWKRVLPQDKELRACLRWMWMREGIVWDPITGKRRAASETELEMAKNGQMNIEDEGERKFANIAVGIDGSSPVEGDDAADVEFEEEMDVATAEKAVRTKKLAALFDDAEDEEIVVEDDDGSVIVVNGRTLPKSSESNDDSKDVKDVAGGRTSSKDLAPQDDSQMKQVVAGEAAPETRRSAQKSIFDDTVVVRRSSLATMISPGDKTPKPAGRAKSGNNNRNKIQTLSDSDDIIVVSARKLKESEKAEKKSRKAAEKKKGAAPAAKTKMTPRANKAKPDDYYGKADDEFDSDGNSHATAAQKKRKLLSERNTSPPRKRRRNVPESAPASEPAPRTRRGIHTAPAAVLTPSSGPTELLKKSASKNASTKKTPKTAAKKAPVRPYVPNDEEYFGQPDREFDSEGNSPKTAAERKRNRRATRNVTRQERAVESIEAPNPRRRRRRGGVEDEPGSPIVVASQSPPAPTAATRKAVEPTAIAPVAETTKAAEIPAANASKIAPPKIVPAGRKVTGNVASYDEYMANDSGPDAEDNEPVNAVEKPSVRHSATRRQPAAEIVAADHTPKPPPRSNRAARTPRTIQRASPSSRRRREQRTTILTPGRGRNSDNDFPNVVEEGHGMVSVRDQMIMQGPMDPPLRSDGRFLTAEQARFKDGENQRRREDKERKKAQEVIELSD